MKRRRKKKIKSYPVEHCSEQEWRSNSPANAPHARPMLRRAASASDTNGRRGDINHPRTKVRCSESNNEGPGPHDVGRADSRVSGDGLPPWPAAVPPFLYLQSPHYSSYLEALFPCEGGSLIDRQGNIFYLVHSA
ncbi:hypothetical protein MRX96_025549 [Rhipicephalus microplus]